MVGGLKIFTRFYTERKAQKNPYYEAKCSKSSDCSHLLCTGKKKGKKKEKYLWYRFKTGNHLLEMTQRRWVYFSHCSAFFCMLSVSGQNKTAQKNSRQLCKVWLQKEVSRDNNRNVLRPDINSF